LSINNTRTLSPGVYCNGIDIQSQAVVTLQPGTYIINRGDFNVAGGATVTCSCPSPTDGVTIILTSSTNASQIGQVRINGGANINLRAPSAVGATYRGSRRAPATRSTASTAAPT
jgi:filamentous hemagglutinin family protein